MPQGPTFSLATVEPRGKRRFRLGFDATISMDAFQTSFYSVACTDGAGPSPAVAAVYAVLGCPSTVEVALSEDLVDGGLYSVISDAGTLTVRIGEIRKRPTEGPSLRDGLHSFFGEDLVWDGDLVESPDGDLATCSGISVVEAQARACVETNGLPWEPSRGGRIRQYVDGSPAMLPQALAKAVREVGLDDRVDQVSGELVNNEICLTLRMVGDQIANTTVPVKVS